MAASGSLGGLLGACGEKESTTTTAAGVTTTVAAGPEPPAQDKFVIGGARPISGVFAMFEEAHFGPAYKIWVDDMNAAGGMSIAARSSPWS